jgi:hypothetical protein
MTFFGGGQGGNVLELPFAESGVTEPSAGSPGVSAAGFSGAAELLQLGTFFLW